MRTWVDGRSRSVVDCRDRGLQYGDGVFETMRVRRRVVRLLDFHLQRLTHGCERLSIAAPEARRLRQELTRIGELAAEGVLKLIVTRGVGARGYRPSGRERATRIIMLEPLVGAAARDGEPIEMRVCATRLGANPRLAGLKTLNRLEQVMARAEWSDAGVGEGLMLDQDENLVCGTMSNLFLRRGSALLTPRIDRCGVAGVMRRWILSQASGLKLKAVEGRVRLQDLGDAEEVFMSNAVAGPMPVALIRHRRLCIRPPRNDVAMQLRARLEIQ